LCHRRFSGALGLQVFQIFSGYGAEGILGCGGSCDLLELPLCGWIDPPGEELACLIALQARVGQRYRWECAEGEHVLAAGEAISKAPQLAAGGLHEKM